MEIDLTILTEIQRDIAEIKSLNDTQDIDGRFRAAERIAANSYYLAECEADAYEHMAELETQYENAVALAESAYGGAATKAKAHAKAQNQDLLTNYSKAKGLYKRLQGLRSQANTLIETVRQSVAHLRDEKRHSGF